VTTLTPAGGVRHAIKFGNEWVFLQCLPRLSAGPGMNGQP
jgi:hypothetical protein